MEVVEQLAPELDIELVVELLHALEYVLHLLLHVQLVVKTDLHSCALRYSENQLPLSIARRAAAVAPVKVNFHNKMPPPTGGGRGMPGVCQYM